MKLRVSINAKKFVSPYGGANQAANTIEQFLLKKGHDVFRSLVPELDVILILSSQDELAITSYRIQNISDYIKLHPNTIVVQRVNSCDEQRGNNLGINEAMLKANKVSDSSVFISAFVKELFKKQGLDLNKPNRVILNGADTKIFYPGPSKMWDPEQKLRIVTHHWSSNFMKGFDIYERLDQLLAIAPYKDLFEFTYIGNVPIGVDFKNTTVFSPTMGGNLADLLRNQHIYVTAARNEAAGMHHVEGMLCGLPVLFLNSGALPEYCNPYGIEFHLYSFEEKLLEMRTRYEEFREKVLECDYSADRMAAQYEELFQKLVEERLANPRPSVKTTQVIHQYLLTRPYRKIEKLYQLGQKGLEFLHVR